MPTDFSPPQATPPWHDAFLSAGHRVGHSHLPGNEHPLFGFLQRVLVHLNQQGISAGLLFPKIDGRSYEPIFDYVDTDGTIWVLRVGPEPGQVRYLPEWFIEEDLGDPEMTYYRATPESVPKILASFLDSLMFLRKKQLTSLPHSRGDDVLQCDRQADGQAGEDAAPDVTA
ncbi:MAG: hypothetical protein VKN33_01285 [Candidatus Sericytochromatia bacterium]|nr:hypothetical protein [Candidatus Sericytochromatia bacterium]